jgi:hypothetical protein
MKLLVFLCASLVGCSTDEPRHSASAPSFTPETAPSTSPVVFLRGHPDQGSNVLVDVVARGLDHDIHGVAFRLHWDPSTLGFNAARGGPGWSRQALALAKEGLPGELVVTWTERGSGGGIKALDEAILGTLDFSPRTNVGADGAKLEFRTERSTVRDAGGGALAVEWRGGAVGGK